MKVIEFYDGCLSKTNDEGVCQIPLFHGTRRYALGTTAKERERFYAACDVVMAFAKTLGYSNKIDDATLCEYQRNKNPYFLDTLVYAKGISKFEYGDFYITSSYSSAISFAYNAGGELGEHAYSQCKGFRDFGIELDDATKFAAKIVEQEYEKYNQSEKIILIFCDVRFSDLNYENGRRFLIPIENEHDAAYMRETIADLHESIDDDDCSVNANFRLLNHDSYTAYALSKKDFRKGFSLFTNITNVEKEIKSNNFSGYPKWDF